MNGRTFVASAAALVILAGAPARSTGQTSGFPTISQRQYTGGSATVMVTGSAQMDAVIPLNTGASYSDGEVTWLQFGVSGSAEPEALITYGDTKEIGISIGRGKLSATGGIIPGEKSECAGKVRVTGNLVAGEYTCRGVTSNERGAGMGKVDITISFTAKT